MGVLIGFLLFLAAFGFSYLIRRCMCDKKEQSDTYKWCMDSFDWIIFILAILFGVIATMIVCRAQQTQKRKMRDMIMLTSDLMMSPETLIARTPPGANPYTTPMTSGSSVDMQSLLNQLSNSGVVLNARNTMTSPQISSPQVLMMPTAPSPQFSSPQLLMMPTAPSLPIRINSDPTSLNTSSMLNLVETG
jgi:hypothetical protein